MSSLLVEADTWRRVKERRLNMHPLEHTEMISVAVMRGLRANPAYSDVLPQTLGGIVPRHVKFFIEAVDAFGISSGWKDEGDFQHRDRIQRIGLANYEARLHWMPPEAFETDDQIAAVAATALEEAEYVLFSVGNSSFRPVLTGTTET